MFNKLFDLNDIPADLRYCFEEVETACGAPWARVVEGRKYEPQVVAVGVRNVDASRGDKVRKLNGKSTEWQDAALSRSTTGWRPTCTCPPVEPIPCTVLDCFAGSGTTGVVADQLGREAILIELSPTFAEMCERRVAKARARRMLGDAPRHEPLPGQLGLFA